MPHSYATCEGRYEMRKARWKKSGVVFPRLRHHFWWVLHNVVAHPLLAYPTSLGLWFHDWTSMHLNQKTKFVASPWPEPPRWHEWVLHNVAVHATIGVAPCFLTFQWHDINSEQMDVEDWV